VEEKEYLQAEDQGGSGPTDFVPSITLESLEPHGPAVATTATPIARAATVLRQARVLGGGVPYNDDARLYPEDALHLYHHREGVFFQTPEARTWAQSYVKNKFKTAGPEVNNAVLEATLLGRYEAPGLPDQGDTLARVRNYMRRDGTWDAASSRSIEAKVASLVARNRAPGGTPVGANKPKAKANAKA
jgi:hypothetical protein